MEFIYRSSTDNSPPTDVLID